MTDTLPDTRSPPFLAQHQTGVAPAPAASEALIVSLERIHPARGTTLEQFAWARTNGAIRDELRNRLSRDPTER